MRLSKSEIKRESNKWYNPLLCIYPAVSNHWLIRLVHKRGGADARDVYQHGEQVKPNMLIRKYNGYEIGIYCFKDSNTGRIIISSIWKRDRA